MKKLRNDEIDAILKKQSAPWTKEETDYIVELYIKGLKADMIHKLGVFSDRHKSRGTIRYKIEKLRTEGRI
jgi:hypothetical protein